MLIDELRAVVGDSNVFDGHGTGHVVDWTGRFVGSTDVVVRPGSTDEVRAVIGIVRAHGRALVPQGGNTGLVGGGVPLRGEVVLNLGRMNAVNAPDRATRQIVVEAGATLEAVQRAAAAVGLRYPVDFGARGSATIGGTIATNAGGVNVLRYGSTRAQVVGLEAVMADGSVLSTMSGLLKDNTGYDLRGLMCGSEGTLGVVTRAVLALVPQHDHRATALVGCASVADAIDVVAAVRSGTDTVDAAELMSWRGVSLVSSVAKASVPFDAPWYVLIETSANVDQSTILQELLVDREQIAVADGTARRDALWRLRDEHTPSIATLGTPLKYDVTVPVTALADFVKDVVASVAGTSPRVEVIVFGHAADGNLHVNLIGADHDDHRRFDAAVLNVVATHRGSISAEHGVGVAKREWLHLTRSADEIAVMRAIKAALDPGNLMNPHVLLPAD